MKKKKKSKPRVAKAKKSSKSRRSSKNTKVRARKSFDPWVKPFDPWVPAGTTVKVAGRSISGMVYVESTPFDEYDLFGDSGSFGTINPRLPVAPRGDDFFGKGFGHRLPDYTYCSAVTRATYLDWLADRKSTEYSTKYAVLYVTGLERRFLFDDSPRSEKLLIVAEVERLLKIYDYDPFAESVLNGFVSLARFILGLDQDIEPIDQRNHPCYPAVLAHIGKTVEEGRPINGKWLLNLYVVYEKYRTTIKRMFPEFKALFISLFNETYPQGMIVNPPDDELFISYRPLSSRYLLDLYQFTGFIGDVTYEMKPLSVAYEIADEAELILGKFSRYLGRFPKSRGELAAHLLLPERIRNQFHCEKAVEISSWAQKQSRQGCTARFQEVVQRVEGAAPGGRITKSQTIKLIDVLAGLSIGMAPDPRLTMYSPKPEDSVILYEFGKFALPINEVSEKYWNIFRQLAVACFVVQEKSGSTVHEPHALQTLISNSKLASAEKIRLTNNLIWMLRVPPTLPMLRQNLKALSQSAQQELVQMALSMAVIHGNASPQRVEAVKKVYKLLGLDVANVYSDLHSRSTGDEPVVVRSGGKSKQTYGIPAEGGSRDKFELDSKRIDSVLDDTARVSSVLGEIFTNDVQTLQSDQSDHSNEQFPGLDHQHASLILELIQRNHWDDEEFEKLAGSFNLMPGGALETLNEWAFEKYDEPLLEEYDGYNLNLGLAEQLEAN